MNMGIVKGSDTYNNKKPRSQWKNRFIYTICGLFAGLVGGHNFYLGRKLAAITQLMMAIVWISLLAFAQTESLPEFFERFPMLAYILPGSSSGIVTLATIVFAIELIWVYAEIFTVKREPDGDAMDDEAGPVRILLIFAFIFSFIILPGILYGVTSCQDALESKNNRIADEMRAERHRRLIEQGRPIPTQQDIQQELESTID